MRVPYVDLGAQYLARRETILEAVDRTLASGRYILGEEVTHFEDAFAALCGVRHAVSVANGTDALILALRALGIGAGDEVITAANSWISTAASIALAGAEPVFADVGPDQNLDPEAVAAVVTERTRAIMPVHLTGRCADMDALETLARQHDLVIVEDAAQAVGARFRERLAGSMGRLACFSLHPLKNLNAAGDAGVITTDDDDLAEHLRLLRNHGLVSRNESRFWGFNSRLDALQAAILNAKLVDLAEVIAKRREHAARYRQGLEGVVDLPVTSADRFDTYHLFVIMCPRRDDLKDYLKEHGISSAIHYPVPIHLQPASADLGYRPGDLPVTESQARRILSLPVHHMLSEAQIDWVIDRIKSFVTGGS